MSAGIMNLNKLPEDIIVRPIISEQSMRETGFLKYTFEVAINATKPEIAYAVEKLFGVKVKAVRTMIYKGKKKRVRYKEGMTKKWKKAVVSTDSGIKEFEIA